jgi:hypothetical protein
VDSHVRIVGVLHIVLGCLGALVGLGILLLFGGLAGIVGIKAVPEDPDAIIAVPILATIGAVIAVAALVLSLPSILAGAGLLKYRPWARILTIVLSALHLLNVPFGTAVGVYSLWVLLSRETEPLFQAYPRRVA